MPALRRCRFAATGDSLISRRLPEGDCDSRAIAELIGGADFRFTNLETVVRHWHEGFPSAQSGGTWTSVTPEMLADLLTYGFNAIAWATNHTLDYSCGGLLATERYLNAAGVVHAGAGATLAEASAVRYLESRGGRVALISATSTFHESWVAGDPRADVPGRPGINPLRFSKLHLVSGERLRQLQGIAEESKINAEHNLAVQAGYAAPEPEGIVRFGNLLFREVRAGEKAGIVSHMSSKDWERFRRSISEARRQSDYVVVSIHSHEIDGDNLREPASFLVEFAHACIDEGAHAVVGHGPHRVRGIEVYRNRPIFYSLGNFIFQNESVERQPKDFYDKYGLSSEASVADAYFSRSANDTRGLGTYPAIWESVVALWEMENGELKSMRLHPISLGFGSPPYQRGWPKLTSDLNVLEDLQKLSEPFGTKFCIENGVAVWCPEG